MDPITTAIVTTASAIGSDLVKSSVKAAYNGLKAVIHAKWGKASALSKAIEEVEANPKSQGQALVLEEKVVDARATEDPDAMQALATLVNELKQAGVGGEAVSKINIQVSGGVVQGVVSGNNVTVGSMAFGAPPEKLS